MVKSGYNGTGVRDIVAEANAPQGSFTNHFRSKEAFASEVLGQYFDYVKDLMREAFEDTTLSQCNRLRRYLDIITDKLKADSWNRGCLIGDFSLETSTNNELLRTHLVSIFQEWRMPFIACIAEAQSTGEISDTFTAEDLAEFLLASWQGAILLTKVTRNPAPLERFKKIAFSTIYTK